MITCHFGHKDILPSDIAIEPGNFFIGTTMLRFAISVKRITISKKRIARADLDCALQSGSVVVSISYDDGPLPAYFVVLLCDKKGSYVMNGPYKSNGHAIPFISHYSLASIVEADTMQVN